MKFKFTLILFFTLTANSIAGEDMGHYEDRFEQANQAYKLGEYDSAKNIYSEIVNNGFQSSELYYNLGNAHFKNGNLPASILYYERALRLNRDDQDIKYNLEVANSFIADKITPVPKLFLNHWWIALCQSLSPDGWAMLFLIALSLTCLAIGIFLFTLKIGLKQFSFIVSIVMLVVTIISLTLGFKSKELDAEKNAIVFSPSVNVKSEPDLKSTVQFVIHEGLKVQLVAEEGDWVRINIADGNSGWIPSQAIEVI